MSDHSKYEPEKLPPELRWKGEGEPPPSWWAEDAKGVLTKVYRSYSDYCDDSILSDAMQRAIENAAYERAAVQFDRLGCIEAAKTCRALIQPPSAEPIKHEDREG